MTPTTDTHEAGLGALREAQKEVRDLRKLLKQRTEDIARVQVDPTMPRLSEEALETLSATAEGLAAMASDRRERVEATALEMLLEWQRAALARTPDTSPQARGEGWRAIEEAEEAERVAFHAGWFAHETGYNSINDGVMAAWLAWAHHGLEIEGDDPSDLYVRQVALPAPPVERGA